MTKLEFYNFLDILVKYNVKYILVSSDYETFDLIDQSKYKNLIIRKMYIMSYDHVWLSFDGNTWHKKPNGSNIFNISTIERELKLLVFE